MSKLPVVLLFFIAVAPSTARCSAESSGWPNLGFSDESLFKFNALRYSLGAGSGQSDGVEIHGEYLSFGFGGCFPDGLGVLVSTEVAEAFGRFFSLERDPTRSQSLFPIYMYVTAGLHSRKNLRQPVGYALIGGSGWATEDEDYLRLGAGLKWTFWALSLGGELSWRGVWDKTHSHSGGYERDWHERYSLMIALELGGWWAAHRDVNAPKDRPPYRVSPFLILYRPSIDKCQFSTYNQVGNSDNNGGVVLGRRCWLTLPLTVQPLFAPHLHAPPLDISLSKL